MRRSVVIITSHVPAWQSASSASGGGICGPSPPSSQYSSLSEVSLRARTDWPGSHESTRSIRWKRTTAYLSPGPWIRDRGREREALGVRDRDLEAVDAAPACLVGHLAVEVDLGGARRNR